MQWFHTSDLNEIPASDLYQILKLRQDIFIIEQNCNYHDIDNIDTDSEHIYLKEDGEIISYSRIVPAGIKFACPSIGRIVVKKTYRGNGFGKEIVRRCLKILSQRGVSSVYIEAQSHLESFYESVGFKKISDSYPVDGISHIKMIHNFTT
jgi:ElaA protein